MKVIENISRERIKEEWNTFSPTRHEQLITGLDLSFDHVLVPIIFRLLNTINSNDSIIDVGCGTGVLSRILSNKYNHVIGIDPSVKSIQIARNYCLEKHNITFEESFIEDYYTLVKHDICLANMVLMDAANLDQVINSISDLLSINGIFIFTITHPCFWPIYWNYFNKKWFNYYRETAISNKFKITNQSTQFITTHIHRPISSYINTVINAGLEIIEICEPFPDTIFSSQNVYNYSYPRFLAFKCRKK
jgi:SAM-dependent methyltransferase